MDNKMTDNEIIKALECCLFDDCDDCPLDGTENCIAKYKRETLDLINRLQVENERLKSRNNFLEIECKNQSNLFWARVKETKSAARKEFADELMEQVKAIHRAVDTSEINNDYNTGFHSATSLIQGLIVYILDGKENGDESVVSKG